jgi:hypothetical protein
MPMKLSTTLEHINDIPNKVNACVVKEFFQYLKDIETSENYQNFSYQSSRSTFVRQDTEG